MQCFSGPIDWTRSNLNLKVSCWPNRATLWANLTKIEHIGELLKIVQADQQSRGAHSLTLWPNLVPFSSPLSFAKLGLASTINYSRAQCSKFAVQMQNSCTFDNFQAKYLHIDVIKLLIRTHYKHLKKKKRRKSLLENPMTLVKPSVKCSISLVTFSKSSSLTPLTFLSKFLTI